MVRLQLEKGLQNRVTIKRLSSTKINILKKLDIYGYKPKIIIKDLKISRNTFYKHFRKITELKFYNKINGISEGGYTSMGYQSKPKWRLHALQVMFVLPISFEKIKWKQNRSRVLSLKKITHDNIILSNKYGITDKAPRFYMEDYEIRCHSNGVMAYIPDIEGYSKFETESKLLEAIKTIRLKLNSLFKTNFIEARIVRYELAKMQDGLAKSLRLNEKKVYINIDGELRLVFDFSLAIDEKESHNPHYSIQDHQVMDKVVRSYLNNEAYLPNEVKDIISSMLNQNKEIMQQQVLLAKNIESHLSVVNEMKELISTLKKAMELKK